MEMETTKMSSRGQVVIPENVRAAVSASEGTLFAVVGSRDTIVLKKIGMPSKEALIKDLEKIAREGRALLEGKGLKESDILNMAQRVRRG
ncbi:AbrB/MazE/SpoVT family DNA-binding domain-containing protein [Candidatus Woesearchaeota archaeon]|nr:AbrB/MazE/SpoVT family DNA-binding domain-containing protein [Candidatus Woesearchaeota archaeon]